MAQEAVDKEIKDLWPLIEESSIECLNQDATHTISHCFKQVRLPQMLCWTYFSWLLSLALSFKYLRHRFFAACLQQGRDMCFANGRKRSCRTVLMIWCISN
jgi:hypothetical protein